MLIYLRLAEKTQEIVSYEYGESTDQMIGKVVVQLAAPQQVEFISYCDNFEKINPYAVRVYGKMQKYIKENDFPQAYTYASC